MVDIDNEQGKRRTRARWSQPGWRGQRTGGSGPERERGAVRTGSGVGTRVRPASWSRIRRDRFCRTGIPVGAQGRPG